MDLREQICQETSATKEPAQADHHPCVAMWIDTLSQHVILFLFKVENSIPITQSIRQIPADTPQEHVATEMATF